jgi:hypothetical protein
MSFLSILGYTAKIHHTEISDLGLRGIQPSENNQIEITSFLDTKVSYSPPASPTMCYLSYRFNRYSSHCKQYSKLLC